MKQVQRSEIVDYQTYEESRETFRRDVMAEKDRRRIHLGDSLTFLFENSLTIRYQIQEMMRAEKLVKESDIRHELETYNGLLGRKGELGCTLLIEIDSPQERAIKLREWFHLPENIYVVLEDGTKVRPSCDQSQIGLDRLSSVQYLKFAVAGRVPVAIGVDHPAVQAQAELTEGQRAALAEDLASE